MSWLAAGGPAAAFVAAERLPLIIGDGVIPEAEAVRDVQRALAGRGEVVLLAHVASVLGQEIPEGATIYNLEPLYEGCRSLQVGYLELLRRLKVWDYQRKNVEFLAAHGIDAVHVPYRYTPQLERAPALKKDIDVLFFGSMSPRRRRILNDLHRVCSVVETTSCYGAELDRLIARAHLVVNIHFCDEPHPLEVVRLNYLMANGCTVVSEVGWDEQENDEYSRGLVFAHDATDLVRECDRYINSDSLFASLDPRSVIRAMPMELPA